MPSNKKSFLLRLDPDIYRAIGQWAGDEFRSVNAHIEFLLREALKKAGRLPPSQRKPGGKAAGLSDREPDSRHGVNTDDSGHSGK